jgi:hypothetical protein
MRLALSVGRLDWFNLEKELTPYEQLTWQAYEVIEPFGERRADLRTALQTLYLMQAQCKLTSDQREQVIKGLTDYVGGDEERDITPDEAARQGKAAFAAIGK